MNRQPQQDEQEQIAPKPNASAPKIIGVAARHGGERPGLPQASMPRTNAARPISRTNARSTATLGSSKPLLPQGLKARGKATAAVSQMASSAPSDQPPSETLEPPFSSRLSMGSSATSLALAPRFLAIPRGRQVPPPRRNVSKRAVPQGPDSAYRSWV